MKFLQLLFTFLLPVKIFLLRMFCSIVLAGYSQLDWEDRIYSAYRSIVFFGPIAFILAIINDWFFSNEKFFYCVLFLVVANMGFGGWMHWKNNQFKMKVFLDKTSEMIISLFLIYIGLEMIISHIGYDDITKGFRMVLQVTSLFYPFGKIAKNVFIINRGKFPPPWLMKKLYDFEKNGDLNELLKTYKGPVEDLRKKKPLCYE